MITLSADAAFSAYEAVRPSLPAATTHLRETRRAATLADVADDYDAFLLDAFGVLNVGETPISGTAERIDMLRQARKRVIVVSNAASLPVSALGKKYRGLGYDFDEADIITSRSAFAASVGHDPDFVWGAMAAKDARLSEFTHIRCARLDDDPDLYEVVDGFVLIGSREWSENRQSLLEDALLARPRPVLVANPDIVAPRETGFSAEPGHFAHRLAARTGVAPVFYGKPFPAIFDLAFARLGPGFDKSRIVMVGDSLHTDILGAHAAGIASALVTDFGFFETMDAGDAISRAGIVPDIILDRP